MFASTKLVVTKKILIVGINQRKFGAANCSSLKGFEYQKGMASGKLSLFNQINTAPIIGNSKATKKPIRLYFGRLGNSVNSKIFIKTKEIIT